MSVTKDANACWVLTTMVDRVTAKGKMTVYAAFDGYVAVKQVGCCCGGCVVWDSYCLSRLLGLSLLLSWSLPAAE